MLIKQLLTVLVFFAVQFWTVVGVLGMENDGTETFRCSAGNAQKGNEIMQNDEGLHTVAGVFIARGNGVECPKIRVEGGDIVGISYISPEIAIGTRLEVRGHYAISTTCRGRVLFAEETKTLPQE